MRCICTPLHPTNYALDYPTLIFVSEKYSNNTNQITFCSRYWNVCKLHFVKKAYIFFLAKIVLGVFKQKHF